MKNIFKFSVIIVLSIIAFILIIFCYPQLYFFDYNVKYNKFKVFSDKPISQEARLTFKKVDELIKKSEIYDPNLTFKIFLRSDCSIHNTLPWQFSERGYAITRPIIQNIFISKADLKSNSAYKCTDGVRPLDNIIAHEITHVLIENKFLSFKKLIIEGRAIFPEDWSELGLLWKEEGYAEYLAGGSGLSMTEGLNALRAKNQNDYNRYDLEYFKYWITVKYLIERKKITISELMNTKFDFEKTLSEAIRQY